MSNHIDSEIRLLCISRDPQFMHGYATRLNSEGGFKLEPFIGEPSSEAAQNQFQKADFVIFDACVFNQQDTTYLPLLTCPSLHTKPAVILDSDPQAIYINLCINSGIDDYLTLPLHPAALCLKLQLLERSYKMLHRAEENHKSDTAI